MTEAVKVKILSKAEVGRLTSTYIQIMLAESSELFQCNYGVYSARVVIHGNLACIFTGQYLCEAEPELLSDMYQSIGKNYLKLKL